MPKTPQQVLEKYRTRVAASGQAYKDGVQNTSKSWSGGYARSANLMVQRFQEAVAEGRPQRAVQNLGDEGYRQKTLAKADRYAQSAIRAADGYGSVVQDVLNAAEAGRAAANNISPDSQEARWQRAIQNGTAIQQYWRNRR